MFYEIMGLFGRYGLDYFFLVRVRGGWHLKSSADFEFSNFFNERKTLSVYNTDLHDLL